MTYAGVYLLDVPYAIDRLYDYLIPRGLQAGVRVGDIVVVPFGGGEKRVYAVVAEIRASTDAVRVKPVLALLQRRFQLPEDLFSLAMFLRRHTLCTAGDAVHAMLPPGLFSGITEQFSLPEGGLPDGGFEDACLLHLAKTGTASEAEILSLFGEEGRRRLRRLVSEGDVVSTACPCPPENIKTRKLYSLTPDALTLTGLSPDGTSVLQDKEKPAVPLRSTGQRALLSVFARMGEADAKTAMDMANVSESVLSGLVSKGLLSVRLEEIHRNPYKDIEKEAVKTEIVLSRAQAEAYDKLSGLRRGGCPSAALLYGVTGSGKTNVILRILDDVLQDGRTAIVMVPEIALTPQTVSIFCRRYGKRVAVIHSSLSVGERFDAWRRIKDGEVDLVIGTRSAVFAPLSRLGLIVIDEEHESTYKSDKNPKYHTRDVAAFRAAKQNALCVFASATPSVESFYKAEKGIYTLVPIRERYGNARLPETVIVDMREELRKGNRSPLSQTLLEALRRAKEEEKQAILFLNRRGYHSAISCRTCGEALMCPHCSISLTYHAAGGGYLLCHACGYKTYPMKLCPSCQSPHLSYVGYGTEKAEGDCLTSLPDVRILRMDADTTGTRMAYERLLQSFRHKEADILLGTQMVTKGHDFPDVTVSGVLLADASLYVNDFRAGERTFSLLTQVIGRAGRGDSAGIAVIQTYSPQNPVIKLAAKQDYDSFYQNEIALRRSTLFPPFCDIAELQITADEEKSLCDSAVRLSQELCRLAKEEYSDIPLQVFGPFEADTYKMGGKYRMRMFLKCRLSDRLRSLLSALLLSFSGGRTGVSLSVDLNPSTV